MRGTRLATRKIIAEPAGECSGRRGRTVYVRGHIALSSGSLSERASGTTVDAIAKFLLRYGVKNAPTSFADPAYAWGGSALTRTGVSSGSRRAGNTGTISS